MAEAHLSFTKLHFKDHNGELRDKIEGQRVLLLMDQDGGLRGELVWRVASGHTIEICEFFIHREEDQRHGWGTMMLKEMLTDARKFFGTCTGYDEPPRRVWAMTPQDNSIGRSFYEKSGFEQQILLEGFYVDGDAVMYIMEIDEQSTDS